MKTFPFFIYFIRLYLSDSTVVEYPDVKMEYQLQKAFFTESEEVDPLQRTNKKTLQEICQSVRKSSTYKMVHHNQDLPKVFSLDESYYNLPAATLKKELKEILYTDMTIIMKKKSNNEIIATKEMHLFSCFTNVEHEHFYLTYGFLDDYFYIFKKVEGSSEDGKMETKLTGLVEPTLQLEEFRNQQHLEKTFLNSIYNLRQEAPVEAIKDRLCTLNANQQFRLCSLIHDAKNRPTLAFNFMKEVGHQCMRNRLIHVVAIKTQIVHRHVISEPRVNVLPCFINSEVEPDFYLTHNPIGENSVFILSKNSTKEGEVMTVESQVNDILVLEYADLFY